PGRRRAVWGARRGGRPRADHVLPRAGPPLADGRGTDGPLAEAALRPHGPQRELGARLLRDPAEPRARARRPDRALTARPRGGVKSASAMGAVEFDPLLPEFVADPYPFYARLRTEDPVHQSPMGLWVLTRYDDVARVLRDPRFGRKGFDELMDARFGAEPGQPGLATSILFRDPPDHTRLRTLVSKAFTPRVIEGMRSHIQSIVDRLLDKVQDAHAMDVIADLAYPLPVTVICEMLGVPTGDHHAIRGWSSDIARSLDAIGLLADREIVERGGAARRALGDYFRALVRERRQRPQADLLSLLTAAEEQGDKLTAGEPLDMRV